MKKNKDNFKFFIPVEISKGKGKEKGKMRISGIASTASVDSDKETMQPKGFLLDHFKSSGFINYNHLSKNDPSAIIGEPTVAKIVNNELYIEAELYSNSKKARQVYSLAQTLEKNSSTRKLGFSIEGKVISRDKDNPLIVKKALITGLAVTASPKCPSTVLQILKGKTGFENEFDWNDDFDIEKAMEAGDVTGVETVNSKLTQQPLKKESLEGGRKKKKKKRKDNKKKRVFLTKSQIYSIILSIFTNNVEKAQQVYKLIEQISKLRNPNMVKAKISKKDIKKAEKILGLVKSKIQGEEGKKIKPKKAKHQGGSAKGTAEKNQGEAAGSLNMKNKKSQKDELNKSVVEDLFKAQTEKFNESIAAINTLHKVEISKKDKKFKGLKKSVDKINLVTDEMGKRLNIIDRTPTGGIKGNKVKATERFKKGDDKNGTKVSITRDRKKLVDILADKGKLEKSHTERDTEFIKAMSSLEFGGVLGSNQEATHIADRLKEEHNIILTQ